MILIQLFYSLRGIFFIAGTLFRAILTTSNGKDMGYIRRMSTDNQVKLYFEAKILI